MKIKRFKAFEAHHEPIESNYKLIGSYNVGEFESFSKAVRKWELENKKSVHMGIYSGKIIPELLAAGAASSPRSSTHAYGIRSGRWDIFLIPNKTLSLIDTGENLIGVRHNNKIIEIATDNDGKDYVKIFELNQIYNAIFD